MQTISNSENFSYPKLQNIEELFRLEISKNNTDLLQVVIVACQHLLEPQRVMFEKIIKLGFVPENIFIVGKAYSSNFEVMKEISGLGITVIQPEFNPLVSFDIQHKQNCEELWRLSENKRKSCARLVVVDDGGVMIETALQDGHKEFVGIEQTSSGFRKLEHKEILVPVFNVARSRTKLELETPYIVALGVQRIEVLMNQYAIEKPDILVVGLGPIGMEIQKSFIDKGFAVTAYDRIHGEQDLLGLVENHEMVIGTTGSQILSHDEIIQINNSLKRKILLISMSSSDREFELWKLRDLFAAKKSIHEDVQFENIIIANNGFPITFKGQRIESLPEEMERTMGLLFAGVMLGSIEGGLPKGLIDIPKVITDILE